jgi:hypothetical protein
LIFERVPIFGSPREFVKTVKCLGFRELPVFVVAYSGGEPNSLTRRHHHRWVSGSYAAVPIAPPEQLITLRINELPPWVPSFIQR